MTAPEIRWQTGLSEDDQRRIRDLIAAAASADGIAPVGDQVLRELSHDRTRHLLALESDHTGNSVVGYLDLAPATEDAPAMAELVVHPERRRRGVGSAMIRTALAEGGDGTRIWAHGNLEPAQATANAARSRARPRVAADATGVDRTARGDDSRRACGSRPTADRRTTPSCCG